MISKKVFLSIYILAVLISCTSSEDDEDIKNDPVAVNLVFPNKNTECNEGTIINDEQSRVTFQWNVSEFTDSYELILENLSTDSLQTFQASTNSEDIILERGSAYKWHVISLSDESSKTAKSEEWRFYNAGAATTNYAPFPADVVSPENGSSIADAAGKTILKWSASDIDEDIKEYEVLFSLENPPTESLAKTTNTEIEASVNSGTEYFWMVKTADEADNISTSDVFHFTVN